MEIIRRYVHLVAYALLICLGWSYGPIERYIAPDANSKLHFSIGAPTQESTTANSTAQNSTTLNSTALNSTTLNSTTQHQHQHRIIHKSFDQQADNYNAYLSESDGEAEDAIHNSVPQKYPGIALSFVDAIPTICYEVLFSSKIARILAHAANLKSPTNELYLFFKVFRL
ncbi:hypothetical protein J5U18_12250 [Sphingobacteriaceae bacterium WQ 2009]|uniref:Uncharacterized protein n=1 Tax=Rhinopithecimicrobium faecis TaxID=2820698 RepID=A0A8T4HBB9_9SPHI|nr:hypothetical protein [Sphingobacteriaceae bacterium WQ 2009]